MSIDRGFLAILRIVYQCPKGHTHIRELDVTMCMAPADESPLLHSPGTVTVEFRHDTPPNDVWST